MLSNVDVNITSISLDFGEARFFNGDWIIGDLWEVRGGRSFSLRYGTSGTVNFFVTPPDVRETRNCAFMLTIVGSSLHFDTSEKETIRIVRSEIVEIELQNSFVVPDTIMLISVIVESPTFLLFITPTCWKATIAQKLKKLRYLPQCSIRRH